MSIDHDISWLARGVDLGLLRAEPERRTHTMTIRERVDPHDREQQTLEMRVLQEHVARYGFAAPYCIGKRVADIGCGTGYGSRLLVNAGACHVNGVDREGPHPRMSHDLTWWWASDIETNRDRLWRHLDGVQVFVCFEVLEHLHVPTALLRRMREIDPERILCSVPVNETPGANPFHRQTYTLVSFRTQLREAFRDWRIALYGQYAERDGFLPTELHSGGELVTAIAVLTHP